MSEETVIGWKSGQTAMGVRCSDIYALGIDKQENLRATMIRVACGLDAPGSEGPEGLGVESPEDFTNINLITGAEIFPNVTQSESMVWSTPDGQTVVVSYNDSRDRNASPINIAGISVSFDAGQTFTRVTPNPLVGHQANFGDPIVVYNNRLAKWFAGDLVGGCGGQGIGLWTSDDAMTWTVGACAHTGSSDDRESMWVDNNAGSPFFGRMYISWNDFAQGQNIFVTHSDDGTTWSAPLRVQTGTFIRNIQLTGSADDGGTVFIAGMDEGGGGVSPRVNWIYRSLDGGQNWTAIQQGPPFGAPGEALCGYFAAIPPIWRHMGWGQPAGGPGGVIHYVYAGRGSNPGDEGDIYYIRSDNNGDTWTSPITLNSDAATGGSRSQWMPSLSSTPEGNLVATWYDRRNTTDLSYEYWIIQSFDNGQSWGSDEPVSDRIIPQPEQPDPGIQACYVGDYNYQSAVSSNTWVTWADGRVPINGHFQQDVFFAGVPQIATGGAIDGTVTDADTGNPIGGAHVVATGTVTRAANTRADGTYHLGSVPADTYNLTVTAFGYIPGSATGVVVVEGETTTQNFALTLGPAHSVSGAVTSNATGLPIPGATLRILSTPILPQTTDKNGAYAFASVPEGTYTLAVSAAGFQGTSQSITVDQDLIVNFALDPVPVALIQDQSPWGSMQNETLLTARGVAFLIYDSSRMADLDFSRFRKVVLVSQQPDQYYTRLAASRSRFEDYVNGGGILEMHLANFFGSQAERTTFPFGLRITPGFAVQRVGIVDPGDPIITTPNTITLAELQNWNNSAHGSLIGADTLGLNVVVNALEGPMGPATAEGSAGTGTGTLVATDSPVEFQGTPNTRRFNENLLCFGLGGVGNCPQLPPSGRIEGTVNDSGTGNPIAGAQVQAVGPVTRTATTNGSGVYHLNFMPEGSYDMTASAYAYNPASVSGVVVVQGQTTTQSFALTLGPSHSVSGTVINSFTGLPIQGATVTILSTPLPPATTDANGMYLFPIVAEGTYNIQASAPGFVSMTRPGVVVDHDVVVDFGLDSVALCDRIAGNLVANCGFESGTLPPWVATGAAFTAQGNAHSGIWAVESGPVGSLAYIEQQLTTTPGATYQLCYWLANTGGPANEFQVFWDGMMVRDLINAPPFPYTQTCHDVVASGASTQLKFGFRQDPAFLWLDDVSVAAE